jgi:Rho-binding antiterminator
MHPYQLIACSFHDELEALATLRRECPIHYRDGDAVQTVTSRIVDVYARDRADFIKLQDGTVIRADHLTSVDGKPVQFASAPFSCA